MAEAVPFFTIGHSSRSFDEFAGLLADAGVRHLVDIRRMPRSRSNPQFNEDVLPDALAARGLSWERIAALGGLRKREREVSRALNGFWTNASFHNYADYALGATFREGLAHLIDVGRERRCAIMCSEAVWWRCHRRIVADYLIVSGAAVAHIMERGAEPARLTHGAIPRSDGSIVYPAPAPEKGV